MSIVKDKIELLLLSTKCNSIERRKELVKRVNGEGEHTKVAVRNIRRDAIEQIKKLQKDGLSEDAAKDAEKDVQTLTDKYSIQIDKHLEAKDKEIMAV